MTFSERESELLINSEIPHARGKERNVKGTGSGHVCARQPGKSCYQTSRKSSKKQRPTGRHGGQAFRPKEKRALSGKQLPMIQKVTSE